MSRSCRVLAISAFRWPTTQIPSITNCLVTIIHTKPVIAILVPKLVAMAMFLSTSGPPSNTWFPGPVQAHNANGIWIGSAVFAQMTIVDPYTLQRDAPFPTKKLPFLMEDLDLCLIDSSLGPPKSSTQTASQSLQLFLLGSLVWQTDRLTDHTTRSVTMGHIYVCSIAMRPNNTTHNITCWILSASSRSSWEIQPPSKGLTWQK